MHVGSRSKFFEQIIKAISHTFQTEKVCQSRITGSELRTNEMSEKRATRPYMPIFQENFIRLFLFKRYG